MLSWWGHSTGGGEVARYIGRHGTKRLAKAVLIGAVPPIMLKTANNLGGLPKKFLMRYAVMSMLIVPSFLKN